ncbi:protein kinase [Micromonospora sp. NPDC050417]|uniref:serine/threonine-protein kinase n=1 Tax=Micromonospora sp. NPDC050417 TaxID=3364280 RepID=UPI0037B6E079
MRPLVVTDRYVFAEVIGQGGMGRVWKAHDKALHRDVAIKEMVPPPGLTDEARQELHVRSLREARAIARLDHTNAVRIFDVLVGDAGDLWIVMEYVPSRSLHQTITADGPISPTRAAKIGLGVLHALQAAHRAGIMHRDVKPANVLLGDDGRIVLTDFGLATDIEDPDLTSTGVVLGSPAYVSPERAMSGAVGPEGDLWSLGATLYAAVEGHAPYARPSSLMSLTALVTEQPPVAKHAGPLAPVLEGLLRKDPAERIDAETAEQLLRQIPRESTDGSPEADRTNVEPGEPWVRPPGFAVPPPGTSVMPTPLTHDRTVAPSTESVDDSATDPVVAVVNRSAGDTKPPSPSVRTRRGWLVGGLAALLTIGLAVGIPLATRERPDGTDSSRLAVPGGLPTEFSQSPLPASASATLPPLTWSVHRDGSGFSVPAPTHWQITRRGSRVEFREPGGDRLLAVSQNDSPNPDPLAELTAQEKARPADGQYRDYHRIGITAANYHLGAADWEFSYTSGTDEVMHVRRRTFVTSTRKGYTIEWVTPEPVWAASEFAFQHITAGFQPAPAPSTTPRARPSTTPSVKPSPSNQTPSDFMVNDTELTYSGKWTHFPNRNLGDHNNDVTVTGEVGATAEYSFTGTGFSYLAELNNDEGNVDVYVDGVYQANVNLYANPPRRSRQVVYQKTGLPAGRHTIKIVNKSTKIGMIDALKIVTG